MIQSKLWTLSVDNRKSDAEGSYCIIYDGDLPLMLKRAVNWFSSVEKHFHTQTRCVKPMKGLGENSVGFTLLPVHKKR